MMPVQSLPRTVQCLVLIALTLSAAACATFNEDHIRTWEMTEGIVPLGAGLAGDYANRNAAGTPGRPFLWNQLVMKPDSSRADDVVRIENLDHGTLRFLLVRDGAAIDSATIDATREATHIRMTRTEIGGIPPVLWTISDFAFALGGTAEHRLSVWRRMEGAVMLIVLPFGSGYTSSEAYDRIR